MCMNINENKIVHKRGKNCSRKQLENGDKNSPFKNRLGFYIYEKL